MGYQTRFKNTKILFKVLVATASMMDSGSGDTSSSIFFKYSFLIPIFKWHCGKVTLEEARQGGEYVMFVVKESLK